MHTPSQSNHQRSAGEARIGGLGVAPQKTQDNGKPDAHRAAAQSRIWPQSSDKTTPPEALRAKARTGGLGVAPQKTQDNGKVDAQRAPTKHG